MNIVEQMRAEGLRDDLPEFNIGDTINVAVRIQEGGKSRIQNFIGAVIARQGTGTGGDDHRAQDFRRRGRREDLPGGVAQRGLDHRQ